MPITSLARNTFIGFIVLAIIYCICYYWLDIPLMYFVYTGAMGSNWVPLSETLSIIFSPESWVFVAAVSLVLAFLLYRKDPKHQHFETLMRFSITIIAAAVIVVALKVLLGRDRPDLLLTDDIYGFHFFALGNNQHSTPSGHATLSFCALLFIARHFNKIWLTLPLMLLAVIICIAKMILADHYFSDLLFGSYLGVTITLWMEVILDKAKALYCPHHL